MSGLESVAQSVSTRLLFKIRRIGQTLVPGNVRLRFRRFDVYRKLVDWLPWEADIVAVLARIVEPGWTAIDMGGHVGRFTTDLAKMVGPKGHVIVFEPHPSNVRLIKERVTSKKLEGRVDIVEAAVSDGTTDTVALYEGSNSTSAEWNILGGKVDVDSNTARLEVPAISLDIYIGTDKPVDFVKMDIEGAEHIALRGMVRILTQQRPVLLLEFHPQTDYRECCDLLRAAGYGLYSLDGKSAALYPAPPLLHALARPLSTQT